MRNHAVTFHFSESETTISRSTFSWLSCEDLNWTSSSWVHFVTDHVLKTLVISGAQEDKYLKLLACKAIVHHLVSITLVTQVVEVCCNVVYWLAAKWSCITKDSIESASLGKNTFNQMANCHSGWNSVRIDNQVGHDALSSKWQVFLSISHSASTFLTMARRKLISNLGCLNSSHLYFDEQVVIYFLGDHHLVNLASLAVS